MMEKTVASANTEEQETGVSLDVFMNKLNLGPKKKLLVLPIGGFLVHRAHRRRPKTIPKNRQPDFCSGIFMIYKRPFCQEFLEFCFERFQVGIWSSAMDRVSNEDDAGVKNVVDSPLIKEEEDAETKAALNNVVVASDNNEKEDEMMKKVVASKDHEDTEKETGMIKSVAVASDHNTVSQEDVEKDAGIKNVVVGYDHNTVSQEDVEKDAGIKNVVIGSDHNTVSQEGVEKDAGIKNVDVGSDHNTVSQEDVKKDAGIKNVVVGSDHNAVSQEDVEKDAGTMKKVVASEDEDNEKGTETDLGIAMEKLNLGPKTDVVKGKVENVEIFGLRRSQRVRKFPTKFRDYKMF